MLKGMSGTERMQLHDYHCGRRTRNSLADLFIKAVGEEIYKRND